jgi:hypothetical protein
MTVNTSCTGNHVMPTKSREYVWTKKLFTPLIGCRTSASLSKATDLVEGVNCGGGKPGLITRLPPRIRSTLMPLTPEEALFSGFLSVLLTSKSPVWKDATTHESVPSLPGAHEISSEQAADSYRAYHVCCQKSGQLRTSSASPPKMP